MVSTVVALFFLDHGSAGNQLPYHEKSNKEAWVLKTRQGRNKVQHHQPREGMEVGPSAPVKPSGDGSPS